MPGYPPHTAAYRCIPEGQRLHFRFPLQACTPLLRLPALRSHCRIQALCLQVGSGGARSRGLRRGRAGVRAARKSEGCGGNGADDEG